MELKIGERGEKILQLLMLGILMLSMFVISKEGALFIHTSSTQVVAEKKKVIVIDAGHGEESNPEFAGELMGWMCERCGEISIGNEWICADPYVQRDHAEDPFDAFTRPTSNRSIYDFIQMMEQIEGTRWADKVPIDLPIYNIAGDQDPVGEYGVGVYQVSNWLIQTGHTVTTKLYSGYRHEIHNYAEIKNEVEAGIIAFMDGILS